MEIDDNSVNYSFGAYRLDIGRGALLKDNEEVKLRPQAFEVLRILIARRGKLVTREELHSALWGQKVVTDDSLGHCLIDIRKALGDSDKKIIRTVPRRGYIFTPPEAGPASKESTSKETSSKVTTSKDFLPKPFSAYTERDSYVFVAYSHKDLSIIYPELEKLNSAGINVWYDEGLEAGTEWSEEIATRIKQATLFLYFVTPDSVASLNCKNEVNYALKNKIPTLIVYLKKTELPEGLSLSLSTHQAILKHEMTEQEYRSKLENRISKYMHHASAGITHAEFEPEAETKAGEKSRAIWLSLAAAIVLIVGYLGISQLISTDSVLQKQESAIHEMAIAILPLHTKGEDASTQFFATQLVNNLRSRFRKVPGLSIRGNSSSQAVLSAGFDLPTIVSRLKVEHIIQGSLELTGSELAIALSVADESGRIQWSQQIHTTTDEFGVMEAEIINAVARHLGISITPTNLLSVNNTNSPELNLVAHKLFLRARRAPEDKQFEIIKSALEQHPDYAIFYAELAKMYADDCWGTDDRNNEGCDLAIQYAEQGLKLDPNLGTAMAVLAFVHGIRYEYQAAQAALDKHRLLPGQEIYSASILATYLNLGQLQLAWDAAQSFYQNDPLNPWAAYFMGAWGYHFKNDPSISEHFERIQFELDPNGFGTGAYPSRRKHRVSLNAAIETARIQLPQFWSIPEELAESWVRPHYEPAYTSTAVAEFRAYYEREDIRPAFFFLVLMFFYQTDEAMDLAFELYDQRKLNIVPVWLRPPGAKQFRSHPRFIELMEYIGIASYWDSVGWPHFCELRNGEYFCGLEIQVQ